MNPNQDQQLESAISRELKALPELTVPKAVADRVMAAIACRAGVPWYRRSWEAWPLALRVASLAMLLALFGGLCFVAAEFPQSAMIGQAIQRAGQWFAGLNSLGTTLHILATSAELAIQKLGSALVIVVLVAAGLGYALCMGLGTLYFRMAFAKR